jgi:hypothetical protein
MQQKTLLSSTAITGLVALLAAVDTKNMAHAEKQLQTHVGVATVLADQGSVQEVQPFIQAIENKIADCGFEHKKWATDFGTSIKKLKAHQGNGAGITEPHKQSDKSAGGARQSTS